ncbi:unnamed protein product [Protopolystoma xenopodis]|uniref:Uncharacterized protein n=1 Tax=Protopolystoma xenopodis TaxID=117903 RepID=A0A3S5CPL8_9PLAT|nr:unnamed protein product [Protopolystoma xenopodis]
MRTCFANMLRLGPRRQAGDTVSVPILLFINSRSSSRLGCWMIILRQPLPNQLIPCFPHHSPCFRGLFAPKRQQPTAERSQLLLQRPVDNLSPQLPDNDVNYFPTVRPDF